MNLINQEYKKYFGINPHIGFVPFIGNYKIESSMEFFYIPLNKILIDKNKISWEALEKNLNEIKKRNHTAILRVYIEYPTLDLGLPYYLENVVELIRYNDSEKNTKVNYNNIILIEELVKFIKKFGKKYDGDSRISFIECGLIGHWGEWHCYPNEELMPDEEKLESLIKAYTKNFKKTQLLTRYPRYRFLKRYKIGFHDDSFCFSTLPSKKHHFVSQLQENKMEKAYLNNVIGGEVRPEEQANLINNKETTENYDECVKKTNCSWLIIQEAYINENKEKYVSYLSSKLGYDFYVDKITLERNKILFTLHNIGVAPLYYNFNCYIEIYTRKKIIKKKIKYDLRKLKPNMAHVLKANIYNIKKISRITFSIKNNNSVINLSNKYKYNNAVILYEKPIL